MRIHLIAVGSRMPVWVQSGYQEYAKRLSQSAECRLQLIEIEAGKRGKNADINRILQDEGTRMLAAIPANSYVIALDVQGQAWNTAQVAQQLKKWQFLGRDISLLVGGPEGLAPDCLAKAEQKWSLSPLTFPHPLVRVIVAEQLYRGWSLLRGHPYHRE